LNNASPAARGSVSPPDLFLTPNACGTNHRFAAIRTIVFIFCLATFSSCEPACAPLRYAPASLRVTPRKRHVGVNQPQQPAMYSPMVGEHVAQIFARLF
jgi:hypothetical protein